MLDAILLSIANLNYMFYLIWFSRTKVRRCLLQDTAQVMQCRCLIHSRRELLSLKRTLEKSWKINKNIGTTSRMLMISLDRFVKYLLLIYSLNAPVDYLLANYRAWQINQINWINNTNCGSMDLCKLGGWSIRINCGSIGPLVFFIDPRLENANSDSNQQRLHTEINTV